MISRKKTVTDSLDEEVEDFAQDITATGRLFDESFAVYIAEASAPRKNSRVLRGYLKLRDPMCVKRMLYLGITYELFVKSPEKFLTLRGLSSFLCKWFYLVGWESVRVVKG